MSAERTPVWAIDFPTDGTAQAAKVRGENVIGIPLDVLDDIAEGDVLVMLTPAETRNLHAALGAALAVTGAGDGR